MSNRCLFISKRPLLTIEDLGEKVLRPCYYEFRYKITSQRKLSQSQIQKLWEANLLGYGQTWGINSPCDGNEEPAGFDLVAGTMVNELDEVLDLPPTSYFGKPVSPEKMFYYEYLTYARADSSD